MIRASQLTVKKLLLQSLVTTVNVNFSLNLGHKAYTSTTYLYEKQIISNTIHYLVGQRKKISSLQPR